MCTQDYAEAREFAIDLVLKGAKLDSTVTMYSRDTAMPFRLGIFSPLGVAIFSRQVLSIHFFYIVFIYILYFVESH